MAIKGKEGSIRIGTTGKVSTLMMQELNSIKITSEPSTTSKRRTQTAPVPISCGVSNKRLQQRKALSSNCSSTNGGLVSIHDHRRAGSTQKKKRSASHLPMLESEDVSVDRTPGRIKDERKCFQVVEIVDLKCRNSCGTWSSPISNQLRRLSFSKVSD